MGGKSIPVDGRSGGEFGKMGEIVLIDGWEESFREKLVNWCSGL